MATKKVGLLFKIMTGNLKDDVKDAKNNAKEMEKALNNISKNVDNTTKSFRSLGDSINSAFQNSKIIGFIGGIKQMTEGMLNASEAETEYIENYNLLQNAYEGQTKSADELITKLKNFYGLDPSVVTKQLGVYRQMANAMDISNEAANNLSEGMLKLQEDISSLYNISFESAGSKLQSALAGQSRAVRSLGADITETGLQQTLYNHNLDISVDQLNRASKTALIYITLQDQLANASGDAARTINSVANQTKIFREQIAIAGRQLGAVFIPILRTILPILNGILMALNAIGEFILGLFGIDVPSMASEFGTGVSKISYGLDNIGSGAEKAGKAVDDLRGKLRSFDKLNVITTPKESSSKSGIGGGGATLGGIDPRLLDVMGKYNKELATAANKAKEIRDHILEWLGFTIDETGKITGFHFKLSTIASILAVGGVIFLGVKGIHGLFTLIGKMLGRTGLVGKGISALVKALKGTGGVADSANSLRVPKISSVLKGIADVALILGALTGIVLAYGALSRVNGFNELMSSGFNTLKSFFAGLSESALDIGKFSLVLVGLGFVTPTVVTAGLIGFIEIIGVLGGVTVALGALEKSGDFKTLVSDGGQVLFLFADIIGGFAGHLVSSFIETTLDFIPQVGTYLSEFAENIQPFVEKVGSIDTKITDGTKNLSDALLNLTKADLLNSLFSNKDLPELLKTFGQGLAEFAPYFTQYYDIIKDIDGGVVESSANAAKSLAEFANNIPNQGGIVSWFTGDNTLADFSQALKDFAPNFVDYYNQIKGVNADVITATSNAAKSLAEFAKQLPNKGGIVSWFTGDNTLDDFAKVLPEFGTNMYLYYLRIKNIKPDVITATSNAAKSLAEFSKELPNKGGIVSWFTGDNTLDDFSRILPQFGISMSDYYNNIKGIDANIVTQSSNAAKSLAEFANNLPNQGGIASWFTGDNTIEAFGNQLSKFGNGFKNYYNEIQGIDIGKINAVSESIKTLVDMANTIKNNGVGKSIEDFSKSLKSSAGNFNFFFNSTQANSIGSSFGTTIGNAISNAIKKTKFPTIHLKTEQGTDAYKYTMKAYASGGFPKKGEIFVAREREAEMVGSINGHTAVANNEQIVSAISIGVAKAMMATNRKSQDINIIASGDTSGMMRFMKFEQKKDDRQYGL